MHNLRQVLGWEVIETVLGRGYRFTSEVQDLAGRGAIESLQEPSPVTATPLPAHDLREAKFDELRALFRDARSVLFVTF